MFNTTVSREHASERNSFLLISAIIPVYDRQAAGERAVDSVLSQQGLESLGALGAELEVIVVDDASSVPFALNDGMTADGRIRLIRHVSNKGAAAARNTGLNEARGEWIAFLDSDDRWLPGKLKSQIAFAQAVEARYPPDSLLLFATGFRRTKHGRIETLVPLEGRSIADFASGCWHAPGSTCLGRRRVFEAVGPFPEHLRRLEDLAWFLHFGLAGGILAIDPFIGAEIVIGSATPDPRRVDEAARAIAREFSAENAPPQFTREHRRLLTAYLDLERASALIQTGHWLAGGAALSRSIVSVPRAQLPLRSWWRPA